MTTISAIPDNSVTPEEIAAVEKILAELHKDHSPALAVVSQFLLAFKMFRDVDSRLQADFNRAGAYHTILSGLLFISSCVEGMASGIDDNDLSKVGASKSILSSISRYSRERYQLWFGLRDEEAAVNLIEHYQLSEAA